MSAVLDRLFPPALPPDERRQVKMRGDNGRYLTMHEGRKRREEASTRWAAVCTLELQGLDKKDIAERLGLRPNTVVAITNDARYIAYRDERLVALDNEFFSMKPLALQALKGGLLCDDTNTALRASEQWFKAAGFGGFARNPEPAARTTAEDVATALLNQVQVNVTVTNNINGGEDVGGKT